ncbi:LOW QUALITY PROTEIN: uncharacterized protein LOC141517179 [Macrotis lagotis]|uniref:LOW QUALITY PROTEIN: uncharacterized protein LOC141517179 n=1 Tax=Macrotis lagotis TaxID=92651 RepID=UPI003D69BF0A
MLDFADKELPEEVIQVPSTYDALSFHQVPGFSDRSSPQQTMKVPSSLHAISLSKSIQVPISDLRLSTIYLEEISFSGSFSSREPMQVPNFSHIHLPKEIIPFTPFALAMSKSIQVSSLSDPSLTTICVRDSSSFSIPILSRASMQVPKNNLPKEAVQIPSSYPAIAICKSTQIPSFSSQIRIEDCPISSRESLQIPYFDDTSLPTEEKQVPYTSSTISIRKSTQVLSFYGTSSSSIVIGDIPFFIVPISLRGSTKNPDSSDIISTKHEQISLVSNETSMRKSSQVSSSLVLYTSNRSIQFPSYSGLFSSRHVQVPSISTQVQQVNLLECSHGQNHI